ncbi:MAG: acylphosphatase [Geodermatophilaceae bacterium]|nr:acylphosphatase [Geodermatophilaceae bacterium]
MRPRVEHRHADEKPISARIVWPGDDHRVVCATADEPVRLSVWVHGRVQGVGFRWWTRARALELGLTGSASNRADGRVEIVAQGPRGDCERLLAALRCPDAPGRVTGVVARWGAPQPDVDGFVER